MQLPADPPQCDTITQSANFGARVGGKWGSLSALYRGAVNHSGWFAKTATPRHCATIDTVMSTGILDAGEAMVPRSNPKFELSPEGGGGLG